MGPTGWTPSRSARSPTRSSGRSWSGRCINSLSFAPRADRAHHMRRDGDDRRRKMIAVWLAASLLTMCGGIGLFGYSVLQWLGDGQWQPIALADYVGVPATRSLLGLNDLLQVAFGLPVGIELITIGV